MSELNWQKSSFSDAAGANCIYVATAPDGTIRLRESDEPDAILTTAPHALAALIRAAQTEA